VDSLEAKKRAWVLGNPKLYRLKPLSERVKVLCFSVVGLLPARSQQIKAQLNHQSGPVCDKNTIFCKIVI
jgi:hypothetical protein